MAKNDKQYYAFNDGTENTGYGRFRFPPFKIVGPFTEADKTNIEKEVEKAPLLKNVKFYDNRKKAVDEMIPARQKARKSGKFEADKEYIYEKTS